LQKKVDKRLNCLVALVDFSGGLNTGLNCAVNGAAMNKGAVFCLIEFRALLEYPRLSSSVHHDKARSGFIKFLVSLPNPIDQTYNPGVKDNKEVKTKESSTL